MKYFTIVSVIALIMAMMMLSPVEGSFCPCNLKEKGEVCGSNGVTYKNRCEFDCTQRDYKKLGRKLNIQKMGTC
ncbi:uncharacterized protein Dwil_GK15162 [Drosophila willistoni]|uniref:Kazal-like domain-containing protein n=1 Tax=Drosophila willistoni TaxID=7260 RepID=B4MVZ3_DROWI|nr:uncharacterized protein LOC6642214 [Drosophila willistoni]EDW75863.1 uncharacterized protein Dwil_GK15162 [Drosophila willistoni]